eukprot:Gb_06090 [translate_table: standard]
MASPFRSSSPVADRNKPTVHGGFTSPGNGNGLRKSFTVNVLPKAPYKNHNTVTPANSPADYPQRISPFKDSSASTRPYDEIKENNAEINRLCPKSVGGRSPTLRKGMKSFMAPTFSAASKATSPRKRILSERNESVGTPPPMQSPVKTTIPTPSKSPSLSRTHAVEISHSTEPMMEDSLEITKEDSVDCMEVDEFQFTPEPKRKTRKLFESDVPPQPSEESESYSFLAAFPDPGEEDSSLPPYDPKRNYLSPRPQFLRYCPDRGLDALFPSGNSTGEEGFGEHDLGKSESSPEIEVKEIEEIQSLGHQMATVDISTQMVMIDCREMQEEVDKVKQCDEETMGAEATEKVEEKFCNTDIHQFGPKFNKLEEEDTTDDEEEMEEKPSGWLKRFVMVVFVLLCASVSVLASGSPGLLPPSLHNNALATAWRSAKIHTPAMYAVKGLEGFWRHGQEFHYSSANLRIVEMFFSVKDVGFSVLMHSRLRFGIIVNNMKTWMDSSVTKLTKSAMNEAENSFQKSHTKEATTPVGIFMDVEDDMNSHNLFCESVESSVNGNDLQKLEKSRISSSIPSYSASTEISDEEEGHPTVDDEERNAKLDDDLDGRPEVALSSVSQEEEFIRFITSSEYEIVSIFEESSSLSSSKLQEEELTLSAVDDFEKSVLFPSSGLETFATVEESLLKVHSEEIQGIYADASELESHAGIAETSLVSDPEEMLVSKQGEDLQVKEASISHSGTEIDHFDKESETLDRESTTSEALSGENEIPHVSQPESNAGYFDKDLEFTGSTKSMISETEEGRREELSLFGAKEFKDSEVHTSLMPSRSASEVLLSSTTAGLSFLVVATVAAIYFASASRKGRKISNDDASTEKVKAKRETEGNYSLPVENMEKTYSRMLYSSTLQQRKEKLVQPSAPRVEFLANYLPAEMSTSDRNFSQISTQDANVQTYERRVRRRNSMSSETQPDYTLTSDFSADSPSYGSFTTYEKLVRKEATADEEQKVMQVTPVRRSSRIRKQAMSPQ